MQDESDVLALCPSFNCYTSVKLAETAARVTGESTADLQSIAEELDDDDLAFEFSVDDSYTISSDEISDFGRIHPIFPVFDRGLLSDGGGEKLGFEDRGAASIRVPVGSLLSENRDREDPCSSSSEEESEAAPAIRVPSPEKCKKSKSTGSSHRRWRFIDLLRRSYSADGKDSLVFLTPVAHSKNKKEAKSKKTEICEDPNNRKISGQDSCAGKAKIKKERDGEKFSSAHEIFYGKNRASKEGEKRRSFLPYRQDLVGFFAKVNGLSRKHPPF